ncbi:hypothetical protein HDA32_000690 [Spinactinospora alkalitolerans]|uniref:Uncharacterized protein n=1 Tax=Spinactinospora alkalitolerans TaxID=687207 RepID=A0A852TUH1_9ACTN|nr:hypothetical protein [Spinactinospora alkalitolerans]NYE45570.1 hypothetical protein [Spinactinospora alkalitolerans]
MSAAHVRQVLTAPHGRRFSRPAGSWTAESPRVAYRRAHGTLPAWCHAATGRTESGRPFGTAENRTGIDIAAYERIKRRSLRETRGLTRGLFHAVETVALMLPLGVIAGASSLLGLTP